MAYFYRPTVSKLIPRASRILNLMCSSATAIVENISSGRWTASHVLEAYIARATEAHHQTNCLTEIMFDTARVRAKLLDDNFAKTGEIVGPLHGVPMSFKDQCTCDTCLGLPQRDSPPP
jgi:Asp-tRNA(Asn)/Glu-tRNA(Gln) amidotransferase A subunit family amidase